MMNTKRVKQVLVKLLCATSAFSATLSCHPGSLAESETKQTTAAKKKALVIISSADGMQLKSPDKKVSLGFFLVELGKMLKLYEHSHDFVFATPEGKAPTLDINGLDLNFHKQGAGAAFSTALKNILNESPNKTRQRLRTEFARRKEELELAKKYLGKLTVSEPLKNTNREVKLIRDEIAAEFAQLPAGNFLSLKQVVNQHRQDNNFDLQDFDFLFMPGGHAPMVDFKDNPALGEIMNVFHEKGKLIAMICHAPIAMTSADLRLDSSGKAISYNSGLSDTKITTVSTMEEDLVLQFAYMNQGAIRLPLPDKGTKLEYYVDQALMDEGFSVEYGHSRDGLLRIAAAGKPRVIYDVENKVLTANGPQSMDQMMDEMVQIVGPER